MNDFKNKLDSVNINEIKDFLLSLTKPCYESELLKIAFKELNILNTDSLTLYQNHFVLFHILHILKSEFEKTGKYLHIHFMRTFLLDYPEKNRCRLYNDKLSVFCGSACVKNRFYCDFHFEKIKDNQIDSISEKYFYLDESNFFKLNKETIEPFLNGTWEILKNYDEYKNSFKILDLPESTTLDVIKKRFKYLAKKFHPDKGNAIEDKFKEINNAYQLLMKIIPNKKIF
jgi:DnaJ domain/DNA-J related protein